MAFRSLLPGTHRRPLGQHDVELVGVAGPPGPSRRASRPAPRGGRAAVNGPVVSGPAAMSGGRQGERRREWSANQQASGTRR
jgi:hypothetical protein